MIETQERLTERALELLALPDDGPKARAPPTAAASASAAPPPSLTLRSCCWTWAAGLG